MLNVPSCRLEDSFTNLQDSPILSCAIVGGNYFLTGSMSGQITISNLAGEIVARRRDHNKYVVQIVTLQSGETTWIATAGWDAKVQLYKLGRADARPALSEPYATISLQTNPGAILFIEHPENGHPLLVVTRRDSTHLYYYSTEPESILIGKQNIAPRMEILT